MNSMLLAMPSMPELLIVLAIILIIFGGSKIPKIMGSFGKGIKEFKDALNDDKSENPEQQTKQTPKLNQTEKQKSLDINNES